MQAPISRAYPTLLDDLIASEGTILFSTFGNAFAIAFRGPPDFIQRGFNFCFNRGVIAPRAAIRRMNDHGEMIYYAVVSSRERLIKGLASQFRSEILMDGEVESRVVLSENEGEEVPTTIEVEFDEKLLEQLARNRAEAFYHEHITHDNFMARQEREDHFVPMYEMRLPRKATT